MNNLSKYVSVFAQKHTGIQADKGVNKVAQQLGKLKVQGQKYQKLSS